ncbi:hypothetical protein [Pseudomonas akapageensis]|uniref:hypothetical protein n=1 Tax=Pseudomonas akapageensis TaxID=2609961 RepID=UPI0015B3E2DF|nr:hypothetical protein [Pseudomonas akapageensis]
MKRTAIFGLFITAALLASPFASPVFAADDEEDCASSLEALKDDVDAATSYIDKTAKVELEKLMGQAEKAQKAGNEDACNDAIEKANDVLAKAQEGQ